MLSRNLSAAAGSQKHQFSFSGKTDRSRRHLAVRAQAGPSNPIGIHAQVWVGDWSKDEAVKAIKGTKDAGYDLIERKASSACSDHRLSRTHNVLCTGESISAAAGISIHWRFSRLQEVEEVQ